MRLQSGYETGYPQGEAGPSQGHKDDEEQLLSQCECHRHAGKSGLEVIGIKEVSHKNTYYHYYTPNYSQSCAVPLPPYRQHPTRAIRSHRLALIQIN